MPKLDRYDYTLEQAIASCSAPWGKHPNEILSAPSSQSRNRDYDWDMNLGYSGAVTLFRDGWSDYASPFRDLAGRLSVPGKYQTVDYFNSDSGDEIDVSRYLSHEPDCFLESRITEESGDSRIVEIFVNISASCGISADIIARRGAAVYSLVESLESCGKMVGLTVAKVTNNHADDDLVIAVRVKEPSEYASPARLAFCLVHPAMLRRIMFRLSEQIPPDKQALAGIGHGYGCPTDIRVTDSNIYIPSILPDSSSNSQFESDANTKKWLTDRLTEQSIFIL